MQVFCQKHLHHMWQLLLMKDIGCVSWKKFTKLLIMFSKSEVIFFLILKQRFYYKNSYHINRKKSFLVFNGFVQLG